MGARKRLHSKDRKAQKQQQQQQQQRSAARGPSPSLGGSSSSSIIHAAAAALSGFKRKLVRDGGVAAVVLVLALLLCAISSSSLMRLDPAAAAKGKRGAAGAWIIGGAGTLGSSWLRKGWLGAQRLGVGVMDSLGLVEEPVETRRRRQVLEGMRLNGVPIQPHPAAAVGRPWQSRNDAAAEERRRAQEAAALAAMAQRPMLLLNGREPDCLSGRCLLEGNSGDVPAFRRLALGVRGDSC